MKISHAYVFVVLAALLMVSATAILAVGDKGADDTALAEEDVSVVNITGVPGTAYVNIPLTLTGTVMPDNAVNTVIAWTVKTQGTTGATIDGNIFTATATGTAVITATVADGLTGFMTVAAGDFHTLAIKSDGTLWAWGLNEQGQLGDGTVTNRYTPVQIGKDNDWAAVAAGYHHTVAIKKDGTLWAWGSNTSGQLGTGDSKNYNVPTQVGSDKWDKVSAGSDHTVAIKKDGTLWAWGWNSMGQVGDSSTTNRNAPVKIGSWNDWTEVSGGYYHTAAIRSDGTLWAWGNNIDGHLGNGTTTNSNVPIKIGDGDWAKVSAGYYHTAAIKNDGTLWAWGRNLNGQQGTGDKVTHLVPTKVGTAENWAAVSAGYVYNLAMRTDGTVWAWGSGLQGQIGDGTTTDHLIPEQIGDGMATFSAGARHTVLVKDNGDVWACGYNNKGQLGDGTINDSASPKKINIDYVQEFSIKVYEPIPPAITTISVKDGIIDVAYSETLKAHAVPDAVWSIEDGSLPDGLTMSPDGTISGTSTESGTFTFTVRASNGAGYDQRELSITVYVIPAIATDSLPDGTAGIEYSETLEAYAVPDATWSIENGGLPDGLTLSSDGTISGIPAENGTFTFTVRASNNAGYDQKELSITVYVIPEIATDSLPTGTVGIVFNETLEAYAVPDAVWSIEDGSLPDGLAISADGIISGIPTENGTFTFTVRASNCAGYDLEELSITVYVIPAIATDSLPDGTVGIEYSETLDAYAVPDATWSIESGSLPDGLTISADGIISGIPTESGTFTFTVRASNNAGYDLKKLSITVYVIPAIATDSLPDGTDDVTYNEKLETDVPDAIWSIEDGNLPKGLTLSPDGIISGIPTESGTFTFTVRASNGAGYDLKKLSITVRVIPAIATDSLPDGTDDVTYNEKLETDVPGAIWSIEDGSLPNGLTLSPDGKISGTPSESGTFAFTVRVSNGAGYHLIKLSITVFAPVMAADPPSLSDAGDGQNDANVHDGKDWFPIMLLILFTTSLMLFPWRRKKEEEK